MRRDRVRTIAAADKNRLANIEFEILLSFIAKISYSLNMTYLSLEVNCFCKVNLPKKKL